MGTIDRGGRDDVRQRRALQKVGANTAASGIGTVTSIGISLPPIFTASGSPVTSSGVITVGLANEPANTVFAGPSSGGAAAPTFRALTAADLPAGTGTVTSVALTVPSIFAVSGSPITTAGTLAITLATEVQKTFFAGPASGADATPTFRVIALTDLPSGVGLTANPLSQFAATTSAQLAGVITDETGTGALVFANSPSLTTPSLDTATATSINGLTITTTVGGVLTVDNGFTLHVTGNVTALSGSHTGTSSGTNTGDAGTVTSVSVVTANGISGSVANATTTPAITLTLGAITPTSVAASGTVTGSNLSGTNTGDQTITLTGDVTGSGTGSFATTLVNIPTGTTMAGRILATNIAAPSTPAAGKSQIYVDSTNKVLSLKDDAGTVSNTVVPKAATAHQFVTAISAAGVITQAAIALGDLPAGTGTVTSVALTVPSFLSVSGSPITTAGTFAVTLATEAANTIFAGPASGAAATPTFRAMVVADIPVMTSAQFAGVISDETGTGLLVFNTSPTFVTPELDTASGSQLTLRGNLRMQYTNVGTGDTALISFAIPNTTNTPTNKTYNISPEVATGAYVLVAPSDTTTSHALFATSTPGAPQFRALAAFDLPTITLNGDVTGSGGFGTITTTLANIPSGTPAAGSILFTAIAAPGTPAAGKASVYVDSTNKVLSNKDDAGTVSNTVVPKAATSHQFVTAISAAGVISQAQPAFTDISGTATSAQLPADVAYLDVVETFTAAQTFNNGKFLLRNPADTFSSTINSGAITAARTFTLPTNTGTILAPAPSTTITNVLFATATVPIFRDITTNDLPTNVALTDTFEATAVAFFDAGITIHEGANQTMGVATLTLGTVVVSTTKVTANSRIFLTLNSLGPAVPTAVAVSARTAGTSFTILSSNLTDSTSKVAWLIIEPF
jgi:hypothetical protein